LAKAASDSGLPLGLTHRSHREPPAELADTGIIVSRREAQECDVMAFR
jgi:hypothetical protein